MKTTSLTRTLGLMLSMLLIAGAMAGAWDVTVNGRPTSDMDNAASVGIDSQTGSIFVAGRRQVSDSLSQFFVVKLGSDGRKEWQQVIEGTADVGGRAGAAAVAVVRTVDGSFAVLQYDASTGMPVSRGVLPGLGEATSVGFDNAEGTVVAAGSVAVGSLGSVVAAAKFGADGAVLWSEHLSSEQFGSAPVTLAVHQASGTIVVGGTLSGFFTVMRLRPDGVEEWRSAETLGGATGIALASERTIAVGQFHEGNTTDFAVTAYSPDGTEEWRRTFRGTADFGLHSATALAIDDEAGAIFAAGVVTENPTGPDMFAVGLDAEGGDLSGDARARSLATRSTLRSQSIDEGVMRPAQLLMPAP
jgi:hypothetical protein